MRKSGIGVLAISVACVWSGVAAQSGDKLSHILPQFFVEGVTLCETGGCDLTHQAHFQDPGAALEASSQLDVAIATQLSTYPLGSSSGPFSFALDPETGAFVPQSESFGPIFAERPQTLGRHKINIGASVLSYGFDSIEGLELDSGDLIFNLQHLDEDDDGNLNPNFESDIIAAQLFLDLQMDTVVTFYNFGITDRIDVGIAVPYVSVDMDATVRNTIVPLASVGTPTHQFDEMGTLVEDVTRSGSASGLGDVVLRSKYNFKQGFATALDIRLPTGDEEDLLGTGATQAKLQFIAQASKYDIFYGGLFPHLNLGYTYSSGGNTVPLGLGLADLEIEPSDEINWAVGFDTALGRRVTFAVDVVGRLLLDTQRISVEETDFLYRLPADPPNTVRTEVRPQLFTTEGDMSVVLGTAGVKFNPFGRFVISLSGLVPIANDRGLQDDATFSANLDYTF